MNEDRKTIGYVMKLSIDSIRLPGAIRITDQVRAVSFGFWFRIVPSRGLIHSIDSNLQFDSLDSKQMDWMNACASQASITISIALSWLHDQPLPSKKHTNGRRAMIGCFTTRSN
jgi:hypothetical protein